VNWSVIAGDLRIAHFIAVHAIQIVPLFACLLLQMTPIPALKRRRLAVFGVSAGVMLVVLATFVQAALGHPLLSVGR
jgi:phosphatidylserine synthase